jgi:CHAT domain-containing protein
LLLKQGKVARAFEVSERLRARGYLDLVQGVLPASADPRAAALRGRIRQLQRALAGEVERPSPQERGYAVSIFSDELAAAEREYAALLDDLRSSAPATAAALRLEVPTSAEVQAALPPDTALLTYLVGEEQLAIFVLRAHTAEAITVPVRALDLQAKVELLRELLAQVRGRDWVKPAASLRRLLLEPVQQQGWLKGVQRIYIVPHGVLHYLPFAALPGSQEGNFLIDEHVLAYLPAAAALTSPGSRPANGERLMAFAPARTGLRLAQPEARSVGRFFPRNSRVLLGRQARESAFKHEAASYDLLHFATHGRFNRSSPLFSHLELEAGGDEDGRLEVHEILGMRLSADLVTLSACDTALGSGYFAEVPAGDEFVGLTRAFLFAGSSSVLASLWEVRDDSTLRLMRSFYSELRNADGASALTAAMRRMRRGTLPHAHPYHWATFVYVGPMAPAGCKDSATRPCKKDVSAPPAPVTATLPRSDL